MRERCSRWLQAGPRFYPALNRTMPKLSAAERQRKFFTIDEKTGETPDADAGPAQSDGTAAVVAEVKGLRLPAGAAERDTACVTETAEEPNETEPAAARRVRYIQVAGVLILTVLAGAFVYANRSEIPGTITAVRGANPWYAGVAAALSLLFVANYGALQYTAFRSVGLKDSYWHQLRLATAGLFLNTVAKSGGMGGLAIFLREAGGRGWPRGRVITGYMLGHLLGQAAFAATLVAALVVVVIDGKLNRGEVFATAVFVVYLLGQVVVGVAALRSRSALRTLYALPGRAKARASAWFGREAEAASDSTEAADELYAAVSWLRGDLRVIWPPVFHALIVEVIGVATVWAVLLSLNTGSGLDVALVAYSIGVLFSIVGVLPAGLGFAEASLGAVFVSFGVATATAAAAVIIYRLFEVWVPFLAGAWAVSTLKRGGRG